MSLLSCLNTLVWSEVTMMESRMKRKFHVGFRRDLKVVCLVQMHLNDWDAVIPRESFLSVLA